MTSNLLKQPAKVKKARDPLYVRLGTLLLFGIFIALLAGRFTLDRVSESLPAVDLRLVLLYALLVGFFIWIAGAHEHLPPRIHVAGSLLFTFWAGWMMLSAMWAPDGARAGESAIDVALMIAFVGIGWLMLSWLPASATSRIWTWFLVTGLIYFALAMAAGPNLQGRYSVPGGGPNVFVRVMILAALAALYLSMAKKKTWPLLTVPVFAVGAALSGSRGGLVAAALVMLLFIIPVARRLGAGKVFGILFVLALATWPALAWNDGYLVKFAQERYVQQTIIEGYSSGREAITDQALAIYADNPWMGAGIDGYYAMQPVGTDFEYPHNLFLATAAEGGTIGLVLLVLALLRFLFAAFKRRPMTLNAMLAVASGAYMAFAALFSGDYYDSRFMWFFLGWAAIEARKPLNHLGSGAPVQDQPVAVSRKRQRL